MRMHKESTSMSHKEYKAVRAANRGVVTSQVAALRLWHPHST